GVRIGFVGSPRRAVSSSIVPSGFRSVLLIIFGPVSGCSRLKLVRLQWPERSGMAADFSAAVAEQRSSVAAANPRAAKLTCIDEIFVIIASQYRRVRKTTRLAD